MEHTTVCDPLGYASLWLQTRKGYLVDAKLAGALMDNPVIHCQSGTTYSTYRMLAPQVV